MRAWCIGCGANPARGASRRNCGSRCLARYAEERYADFGPTLMAEHLAKEELVVDHETLRRWRLAEGKRTVRRRQQKHRQWRERKPCFGAMVQLDGSHHDWFEGRRAQVRADGDGGRRDQPDAGAVFRGRDDAGQLRCVGRLGAPARTACQPVCGPGQHLYRCEGVAIAALVQGSARALHSPGSGAQQRTCSSRA